MTAFAAAAIASDARRDVTPAVAVAVLAATVNISGSEAEHLLTMSDEWSAKLRYFFERFIWQS